MSSLKLIASAFREGNTNEQNASSTAKLLQMLEARGLSLKMAVGCYKGKREVSVIATGIKGVVALYELARYIRKVFAQECVYVSVDGQAKLIGAAFHDDKRIGQEVTVDKKEVIALPENYTETLNGKILYVV